jgi:glycosyltransferase involved in cell wall biosynthesis
MPRSINSFFISKNLVKKASLKLVLDADGFPLDERVDFSGLSPLSWRYRFFRDVELSGFHLADSILCRSQKAKEIITARAGSEFDSNKVIVINNGTFSSSGSAQGKSYPKSPLTVIYAGSLGPQYLLDDMLHIFEMILHRFPEAIFKILTFKVEETNAYIRHHFPKLLRAIEVKSVPAGNVLEELEKADIAFSFRKPSFSMQGVAPIKVAEYLRAGLSIAYTPLTGDVEELLGGKPFAYRMDIKEGIKPEHFLDWVKEQVDKDYSQEVRNFASEKFSIKGTAYLYHQAIQYGDK